MVCAQIRLQGKVTDDQNHAIAAALIRVIPEGKQVFTDEEGNFLIDCAEQPDRLWVTHAGFQAKALQVNNQSADTFLEISLRMASVTLEEVQVQEQGILEAKVDHTLSVQNIDQNFLQQSTKGTFAESLSTLAGVNNMNVGVGISKPVIRGMSGNRVMVAQNGIKQESQQWGADHGLEIDPFDAEQVQLIKGPVSLLYGSDGMGGVIRIEDKPIQLSESRQLNWQSMYQANNHAFSNSLQYRWRQDRLYYDVRLTHQSFGDYRVPSEEFTYAGYILPIYEHRLKNTAGKELHASLRFGYDGPRLKSSWKVASFNQVVGIFTGAIGLPRSYNLQHAGDYRNIEYPRQENSHLMVTSNTSYALTKQHKLELDLGFQRNQRRELSFPAAHGIAQDQLISNLALGLYLNTYTANFRHTFAKGDHYQVINGLQWQYNENSKDGFEFLIPAYTSNSIGVFQHHLYTFNEHWVANFGVRYDVASHAVSQHLQPLYDGNTLLPTGEFMERTPDFDRNFSNVSAAIGVNYLLSKDTHIKLNLGNSFRFPTVIELASNGVHHGNFRHEIGDNTLVPENGYQADLNILHQRGGWSLDASAFFAYYENYIYLSPSGKYSFLPSGGTMWQYKQNKAVYNGYEFTGSYQFKVPLKIDLVAEMVQNLNLDEGLPLPLTPAASILNVYHYQGLSKSSEKLKTELSFGVRYYFAQNRVARNEQTTPSALLFNVSSNHEWELFDRTLKFQFIVENLFNTPYFNHISRYRLINLPEQGRNFMVKLQMPLLSSR
ncbi:TonB-dependent receptor [Algivirga pacifica]|uniref:TonB-dependent receptor n=2 Tax=Algivirga pacifica TaxID=1162670 RepID=A0ABP9CUL2_9BACT